MLGRETAISSLHEELEGEEGGAGDVDGEGEEGRAGDVDGEREEGGAGDVDGEREEGGAGDVDGEGQGEGGGTGDMDGEGKIGGDVDREGDSAAKGGDDALDLAELEEMPAEECTETVYGGKKKMLPEDIPFLPQSAEDLAACSKIRLLWLNVLSKSDSIVDKDLLLQAKINSKFAIVDRKNMSSPWRCVVMQKLRNDVLVLFDEMGDGELARVQSTEDEGPVQEWGLYYRHPTVFDFVAAKSAALKRNMEQSEAEEKLNESPT
ncbi:predicted protein [Thalassiosira pseudonana CCMP1335]|uniref:Uncharacterized protein n=1 Tax=Thalassiosira pseudonana TaxID=35128 RepID=B8LEZ3_THAPS|nr:predicted protein [Thalassiosira pseudonana CCMP1335]EED86101.1 predicted protein [Thalassiosira pseudonana CCMP1335]|eukprot:g1143.t1 g1143   contig10:1470408-1471278(+)